MSDPLPHMHNSEIHDTAPPPIRDAAALVLLRPGAGGPEVLMGRRGAGAAFMPSKYVFPGGAVDAGDAHVPLATSVGLPCAARLLLHPRPQDSARLPQIRGLERAAGAPPEAGTALAHALAAAAIRELWEETGLILGRPGHWPAPPPDWEGFAATGNLPAAGALRFVFRAITPPGRTRRFDARFFLADATALAGGAGTEAEAEGFPGASGELTDLRWLPLAETGALDLPFVTELVLAEVAAMVARGLHLPESIPFFDCPAEQPTFSRIP